MQFLHIQFPGVGTAQEQLLTFQGFEHIPFKFNVYRIMPMHTKSTDLSFISVIIQLPGSLSVRIMTGYSQQL